MRKTPRKIRWEINSANTEEEKDCTLGNGNSGMKARYSQDKAEIT